jgi:hypothetical protein
MLWAKKRKDEEEKQITKLHGGGGGGGCYLDTMPRVKFRLEKKIVLIKAFADCIEKIISIPANKVK